MIVKNQTYIYLDEYMNELPLECLDEIYRYLDTNKSLLLVNLKFNRWINNRLLEVVTTNWLEPKWYKYSYASESWKNYLHKIPLLSGKFVEKKIITIKADGLKTREINISKNGDTNNHYGYTNLNFNGDANLVQLIELNFGGEVVDKIFPKVTKKFDKFCLLDYNTLPCLNFHEYKLRIVHLGDLEISYDVVQINNPIWSRLDINCENYFNFQYSSRQYCFFEHLPKGLFRGSINDFSFPCGKIKIVSDNPILNCTVLLCKKQFGHEFVGILPLKKIDDNNYEYIFNNPVYLYYLNLIFRCDICVDQTNITIFVKTFNGVIFNHDHISRLMSV